MRNKILNNKLGVFLPPLADGIINNILEFILLSLKEEEVETPTKPIVEPIEKPYSPPAPGKDDPWQVPRPIVIPGPKAFRFMKI